MKNKKKNPLSPEDIRKKARKILQDNPSYMKDEPTTVGSPDSLSENLEDENEPANRKNS